MRLLINKPNNQPTKWLKWKQKKPLAAVLRFHKLKKYTTSKHGYELHKSVHIMSKINDKQYPVVSLGACGGSGLPRVTPIQGRHPNEILFFCGWIYREHLTNDIGRRRGWEWWRDAKKGHHSSEADNQKGRRFFWGKNRMTPSVAAPGDTNLSDATDNIYD